MNCRRIRFWTNTNHCRKNGTWIYLVIVVHVVQVFVGAEQRIRQLLIKNFYQLPYPAEWKCGEKCYLRQTLPVVVGLVFRNSVHCGGCVGGDRLVWRVEEVLQVGGGALCLDDVDRIFIRRQLTKQAS